MPIINVTEQTQAPTSAESAQVATPVEQPRIDVQNNQSGILSQSNWSSAIHEQLNPKQTDTPFTAGFKLNNPVYNWSTSETIGQRLGGTEDPNYDFVSGIKGTKYMQYASQFANTVNDQEANQLKAQLDKEEELRSIASQNSFTSLLGAVAGSIADPTILIPGIAGVKAATVGKAAIEGFAASSALTGTAIGLQEAQLQATQVTRTAEESAINIGAGAVIGGVLGATVNAFNPAKVALQKKAVERIFRNEEPTPDIEINSAQVDELHSVGAAQSQTANAEEVKIAPLSPKWLVNKYPTIAEKLDKWVIQGLGLQVSGLKTPALSGITSPSFVVRDTTRRLFNQPLQLKEQMAGEGFTGKAAVIPTETRQWVDAIEHANVMKSFDNDYQRYLERTNKDPSFLQRNKERSTFDTEVMKAWNRNGASDIPEAREAATKLREAVQKVNKRLVELDLLDDTSRKLIDNGDAMRVYDVDKVAKERAQMRQAIIDYYNSNKINTSDTVGELQSKIDDSIDSILRIGDEQVSLSDMTRLSQDRGVRFTKARTIDVPNKVLEPWLVMDASAVGNLYLKQASNMIRFQEALNEAGYESISALKKGVKDEYSGKKQKITRKAAEAEVRTKHPGKYDEITDDNVSDFQQKVTQEIEAGKIETRQDIAGSHAKLDKELAKQEDFLNDIIAISLGQYSKKTPWDSALRLLKTYNGATMLGGATLSSLNDLVTPIYRHGLSKVLGGGWFNKIKTQLNPVIRELSKKDAEQLGMIVEYQQNSIINAMFDIGADHRLMSNRADKFNSMISNVTGKLNLLEYWTGFGKNIETMTATNDIMSRLREYSTQSNKSKTWLNEHFIDEKMGQRILQQQQKYGITNGSMHVLNIDQWTDHEAQRVMQAAVIKNVRAGIITPGKGDAPLWMQSGQLGSTVLQFKSFISGATGNILLRSLQQKDANVLMGSVLMGVFGIFSQLLKDKIAGRNVDYSESDLVKLGISNSGLLGLLGDPVFNQILRNPVASKNSYRFQQAGMVEYLGGPSASVVNNIYTILQDVGSGDISDSTVKKAYRLIPYNNLFYVKGLINQLDK